MSHTPTSSDYIRMLSRPTRGLRLIIKEHKDLHNNEQDAVFALTGYTIASSEAKGSNCISK